MPLAYVHLVHLLVDSLMLLAPLALYPRVGILSVPLTGLLTVFYRGLLELSKSFLDPFNNEADLDTLDGKVTGNPKRGQNIRTDCLIAEVNAASTRWWRGIEAVPFDTLSPGEPRIV